MRWEGRRNSSDEARRVSSSEYQRCANLVPSRTAITPMAVIVTTRAEFWRETVTGLVDGNSRCWIALRYSIVSYKSSIIWGMHTFYICKNIIHVIVLTLPTTYYDVSN